ncbi:MAG: hypothetical protein AAGD86_00505 [Pseudomonadota bacterium]
MKTTALTTALATSMATALLSANASACAFHADGFGMGSFGTRWTPYDAEQLEEARARAKAAGKPKVATEADRKTRPTFSSAATRAVESAKTRSSDSNASSASDTKTTRTAAAPK